MLDKMELKAGGRLCGSIERQAVAMAAAYDIYLERLHREDRKRCRLADPVVQVLLRSE